MLKDITKKLEIAKTRQPSWVPSYFMQFFERLLAVSSARMDWDKGSGENWAAFLNEETVALVSTIIPLAFIRDGHVGDVEKICSDYGVVVISVSDFDEKVFSLAAGKISETFGINETDIDSEEPVSANDVWFHTV